ncbi:MAG TPA: glycosyltransferase family 4 protein [Candidatus Paceibacterota bacterium]
MKLYYIADVRLPTERAHGLQIMKMCEAFARGGQEVTLLVPNRKNNAGEEHDPFVYYGVERNFEIRKVASPDFLGRTLRFGNLLYRLDALFFHLRLLFTALPQGSVVYARNPRLLSFFSAKKHYRVAELHSLDGISKKHLLIPDRLIVLTSIMRSRLIEAGIEGEKILVAPDGVDLKKFDIPISKNEARQKLGLPKDKRIVLYTGHLYSWKGGETLAEAAKEFGDDYLFVFIGGVEPELSLFKKKYEAANVRVLPFAKHEHMPFYMKAADVLVIPNSGKSELSKSYTSPLKLFEYMASGRPIVASDLPSLREILSEKNCFFAQSDSSHSFAETLREALENPQDAEQRRKQAYTDVQEHTWEKRAGAIIDFCTHL